MVIRRELAVAVLAALALTGYLVFHGRGGAAPVLPARAEPAATNGPAPIASVPVEPQAAPAIKSEPPARLKSRLEQLFDNEGLPNLRAEELAGYLQANHRSRDSLLGAYRTTRDAAFLREALEKYPNDPRVQFDAVFFGPAEDRRKWLEAFKEAAADNSLPYYLSARDYFKAGQTEQAVQEVVRATTKAAYQDYSLDFEQNAEEAYRAAGFLPIEAKAAAGTQLLLPQLAELKQTGVSLVELAKTYGQSGDAGSAQNALQMAISLGQRLNGPDSLTLIQPLVGIAIQRLALAEMDPTTPYGDSGQTVQNAVDALVQQRQAMRESVRNIEGVLPTLPADELGNYFDRLRLFGERATVSWLRDKYASQ
jgi:hypothetical protein